MSQYKYITKRLLILWPKKQGIEIHKDKTGCKTFTEFVSLKSKV